MSEKKSFWTTLPGILTGVAGIITATGGLLIILYQIGVIGPKQNIIPNERERERPRMEERTVEIEPEPEPRPETEPRPEPILEPEPTEDILDPSNEPPWDGAWTNIAPENPMAQSFIMRDPYLTSVEIGITTGNPGRGGDSIILRIVSEDGDILARTSKFVDEGFEGWLNFRLSGRGLRVAPGRKLIIELKGSGKIVFGWKYGPNTYPNGSAIILGTYRPDRDFFFRINR